MKRILLNTLSILTGKERGQLYRFVFLNALVSIIDIASLVFLVLLVSLYAGEAGHAHITAEFLSVFVGRPLLPIVLFAFLFALKSVLGYVVYSAQFKYVYSVASRISRAGLVDYLDGNYTGFVHTDSSVHLRKILHQPIEFCQYVLWGIQQAFTEAILSLLTITVILIFNAWLFLLLTVVLAPPVVLIAWFSKRKLKMARANVKVSNERAIQHLHEALAGYIESNIYDRRDFFTSRFSQYQEKMSQYLADVQSVQGVPSRLIEVCAVVGLCLLIVVNKLSGSSPAIEIINIGAFMAAAYKIIPGIVKIFNLTGQVRTYSYTVDGLVEAKNKQTKEFEKHASLLASVEFDNVSFKYGNHSILNGFGFSIAPGELVGVSGSSGKGKTTFVNLLLGFLQHDAGDILMNGAVVNVVERQQFWRSIAYAQQRPFLVNDTLLANIILSEARCADSRLQEVIDMVGLNEFVDHSAHGINTVITENGKNISGGQRQRIALARALYKDAPLIILDEPCSELDAESERVIIEHLKALAANGKMIILITHNKDSLLYCNKTYLVD